LNVFSGSVVTAETVEKIIKKDMIDPTNGKKLIDSDLIPIQRVTYLISRKNIFIYNQIDFPHSFFKGGTGYAGSGASLSSKKVGPAMIS